MPLNYVTMSLKGLFIIGKHEKALNNQNPNPRRCNTKSLWAPLGLVGQPTSQGRNLVILSLFGAYDTLLERSRWLLQVSSQTHTYNFWPVANRKKTSFRGSKLLWKFRTRKTTKNSKCWNEQGNIWNWLGGLGGIGGWPPISTWIIPPPLGRNGPHCV